MTHEDREAPEADRSRGDRQQGGLNARGDRPDRPAGRFSSNPLLYRLKRSLEIFERPDGDVYLLRLGAGDDLVIRSPSARDRALLRALDDGFASLDKLCDRLGRSAGELSAAIAELTDAGLVEVRDAKRPLSAPTAERFDRQLVYLAELAEPGESADALQATLADARIAIIGCGGLGSWVACGLSEIGVGSLVLIDDDRVELSNLNRQILFSEQQLGELKVDAAADSLRAHNSSVAIETVVTRIEGPDDLRAVLDSDVALVVCTGDWPPHDLGRWVNSVCAELGIAWIGAGQFPPRLRVGPLVVPGVSACLECLEADARRTHPLYDEIATYRDRRPRPDPSVGPVSAVIGSLIASEAMHLLVGSGSPASLGHTLLLDLRSMRMDRVEVRPDPECGTCAAARAVSTASKSAAFI